MAEVTSFNAERIQAIEDAEIVSANIDGSGHLTLTRKDNAVIDAGSASATPSGALIMFAGGAIPDGWLLCDGRLVSRTTYSALFSAIGETYGIGDGSTTFALPDMRYTFPRGAQAGGLGFEGGSDSHVHTVTAHSHEIENHDHELSGGTSPAKAHIYLGGSGNIYEEKITGVDSYVLTEHASTPNITGDSGTTTTGVKITGRSSNGGNNTGNGGNNANSTTVLPPYLNLNFIIKT
jgi:microcystin-dependent protein